MTAVDRNEFNTALAKRMQSLKTDMGAAYVRQGYRGTGSHSHRRQIWVGITPHMSVDMWLEESCVRLGGITRPPDDAKWTLTYNGSETVDSVYLNMQAALRRYVDVTTIIRNTVRTGM